MRITRFLFFATIFCVTFEKVHWNVAGNVSLADILALGFLVLWTLERLARRDRRLPRTSAVVACFGLAFLARLPRSATSHRHRGRSGQFGKGIFKWAIHFLFLIAAVTYLGAPRRAASTGGRSASSPPASSSTPSTACSSSLAAQGGRNLDNAVLSPITGGASSINIYGAVDGQSVYRPNALTGDPNHLGIMLLVPLLVLLPVYLRLPNGAPAAAPARRRARVPADRRAGDALAQRPARARLSGCWCSRVPYRRRCSRATCSCRSAASLALVGIVVLSRLALLRDGDPLARPDRGTARPRRTSASTTSSRTCSRTHPLFGLGFNNFSVYYELVTGKTNWGPHSFYVALLVETGLVGAAVFVVFLWYLFRRLHAARALGRALAAAGDPAAARVRPLAWGLTAALAGTLAANFFYLTMTFYYFYVLAALVLAAPVVFSRRGPALP